MNDERRISPRLREANSVAVKVVKAPDAPDLEGETFFSTTGDVSVNGIRFNVHTRVPEGSILELRIGFARPLGAFRHVGQVAWIRPEEQQDDGADDGLESYAIGVEFLNQTAEKLLIWRDIIERKITYSQDEDADQGGGSS